MWPVIIRHAALVGMAAVSIGLIIQMLSWRSSNGMTKSGMTRRHQRLRVATGLVLITLLGVIAWGPPENLLHLLFYWCGSTVLVMGLVVLALLDVRETLVSYAEHYIEMTRGVMEEETRNR